MFHTIPAAIAATLLERGTLLLNHVVAAEPAASERLRTHAGRSIQLQFEGWPVWLPPLPAMGFRVTPAGLFEWCGPEPLLAADLRVSIDASNPAANMAQAMAGDRPKVDVAGDAGFATDVNWLFDNLRWDAQDDLARLVGQAPAREISRLMRGIGAGVREAVTRLSALAARRPGGSKAPPDPSAHR